MIIDYNDQGFYYNSYHRLLPIIYGQFLVAYSIAFFVIFTHYYIMTMP